MSVSFGRETQRNKWDDMEVVLTMVPVAHPGIGGASLVDGHAGSAMPVVPLAVHPAASRVRPAQVSSAFQFVDTPPIHLGIRLRRFSNNGTLSAFGAIRAGLGGTGLSPRTLRQRKLPSDCPTMGHDWTLAPPGRRKSPSECPTVWTVCPMI